MVSEQEIAVFAAIEAAGGWITSQEIAARCKDVSRRTVSQHLKAWCEVGLVDVVKMFGGYRYRLAGTQTKNVGVYLDRMRQAREALITGKNEA